jgi:hypothetical protein
MLLSFALHQYMYSSKRLRKWGGRGYSRTLAAVDEFEDSERIVIAVLLLTAKDSSSLCFTCLAKTEILGVSISSQFAQMRVVHLKSLELWHTWCHGF